MDYQMNSSNFFSNVNGCEWWKTMTGVSNEEEELLTNGMRKGPWTEEEDAKLTSAIDVHGAGRWDALANLAGLKRSGKSCRLRWRNYLRPDLRRGPFTLNEQLLIIELQLRWHNRWSKIAESLPGRTDNEIKNYWRTKVQKLARQFHCDVNSPEFRDALRQIWIPRLIEQIHASESPSSNAKKAQSDGPDYQYGLGLMVSSSSSSSSSSTSSETCCLFDTHTSWAQNSLDQNAVGPVDLYAKPSSFTNSCSTHIYPESGSCTELDLNWEQINNYICDMTLNDEDDMWFLQQQLDYLA